MSLHNYWRSLKKPTPVGPVDENHMQFAQQTLNKKVDFENQGGSDTAKNDGSKSARGGTVLSKNIDEDESGILPDENFVKDERDMQNVMMVNNSIKRKNDWTAATMEDPEMIRALNEGAIDPWNHVAWHKYCDRKKDQELTKEGFFPRTFQTSIMRATASEKNFR
jgi:hypothetical protein